MFFTFFLAAAVSFTAAAATSWLLWGQERAIRAGGLVGGYLGGGACFLLAVSGTVRVEAAGMAAVGVFFAAAAHLSLWHHYGAKAYKTVDLLLRGRPTP